MAQKANRAQDVEIDAFSAQSPPEVHLPQTPLVRVLAQVRFPIVLAVEKPTFVASFQELVRGDYPIMRHERTTLITPSAGDPTIGHSIVWRFSTPDQHWRLSLAPNFLALESKKYESRAAFVARLRHVLAALKSEIKPGTVDRIGLRYIDCLTGAALQRLPGFVRPEVLGILPAASGQRPRFSFSESRFDIPAEQPTSLTAKWGLVPPGETFDPGAFEPINEESWILDLDMSCSEGQAFDLGQLVGQVDEYARRTYSFFRWVVSREFLEYYGGVL